MVSIRLGDSEDSVSITRVVDTGDVELPELDEYAWLDLVVTPMIDDMIQVDWHRMDNDAQEDSLESKGKILH